jgi:hypothetical protein
LFTDKLWLKYPYVLSREAGRGQSKRVRRENRESKEIECLVPNFESERWFSKGKGTKALAY